MFITIAVIIAVMIIATTVIVIWEFPKIGVPYFGVLNKNPTI